METTEERLARKKAALAEMCDRLYNLEPSMLGCGPSQQPVSYTQLAQLLGHCLGMGEMEHKEEFALVQEAIWVMLIDKRDKCHKDPQDLYFHQTFLNLIAYFRVKGIINGKPTKLFNILCPKADKGIAKNVDRAIPEPAFPAGSADMMDYYIGLV